MPLFCHKCGKEINSDALFCRKCGEKVIRNVSEGTESAVSTEGKIDNLSLRTTNLRSKDHMLCLNCGAESPLIRSWWFYIFGAIWTISINLFSLIYWFRTNPYQCKKCKSRHTLEKVLKNGSKIPINSMSRKAFFITQIVLLLVILPLVLTIIYEDSSFEQIVSDERVSLEERFSDLDQQNGNKREINSTEDIIQAVASSVVNIVCSYEDLDTGEEYTTGGSGVIWRSSGIIITNNHIIPQNETDIFVSECVITLPDIETGEPDEIYFAEPSVVAGISDYYDLALLTINEVYEDEEGIVYGDFPRKFQEIDLGLCVDSDDFIKLGEKIIVLGYPTYTGGYNLTITEGVVSSYTDDGFISTSAKIDSGNSGGLAVDKNGCMVGVPTAVIEGDYESIGLVIPGNIINDFLEELEELDL